MSDLLESHARTKWCPFVRWHFGDPRNAGPGINRSGSGDGTMPETLCIGSDCMAWRETNGSMSARRGVCGLTNNRGI